MNDVQLNDVNSIIDYLKQCDDAYNNSGDVLISDREYDRLKSLAFKMQPSNDYFCKIGAEVRGGKIKLPYIMGSLDQVPENEWDKWVEVKSLPAVDMVASDKLDGFSAMIVYNSGKLSIAYSRGDGVNGADITRHIRSLNGVNTELPQDIYLVVRGEAIMKRDVFNTKYSSTYKNGRNMVSGCMNRKETDVDILTDIDFVAYSIVDSNLNKSMTQEQRMQLLQDLGFITVHTEKLATTTESTVKKLLMDRLLKSDYELDGLVVTFNNIDEDGIAQSENSLNPTHSVKYKMLDLNSVVRSVVMNVHWEISKSGYLKPRVEIKPVELYGTTVTFATGFNAKYISDNKIGKGAIVELTKAGSVIPYLLNTVTPANITGMPEGEWSWNENLVEAVVDKKHPEVLFKQVLSFFETINVDQLKEASLRKVFDHFNYTEYEHAILTILDLSQYEWENIIGANGIKIYNSLHKKMSALPFEVYLGAVNYMGIGFGVRKAKLLIKHLDDKMNVFNLSINDIIQLDGFDVTTATQISEGLPNAYSFLLQLQKSNYVTIIDSFEGQTKEMTDLNVVFTGFRDSELESAVNSRGGKVGSSVSKKTTHVLTNEPTSTSGKAQKARELGITIMTPDEFKELFNV